MEQYNVTGMSCAACSARVEKAVSNVEGVTACSVSLLTNSMGVEGTAREEDIIKAVVEAGYGASKKKAGRVSALDTEDELKDTETPKIRNRLIASLIFIIPLMYVSMGHMMLNWPVFTFLDGNHLAIGLLELLLAAIIMVINQRFFVSGFKGLIHRAPNMDTLISLGASAAFIYSVVALFAMSDAYLKSDFARAHQYMDELYFESAATILTLITVGKLLEARSKGKTTNALKALMRLKPKTAVRLFDGREEAVPIEAVKIGDRLVIRAGESIPADGEVIEGNGFVDESMLTGESIPVDKAKGDSVYTSSINQSGYFVFEVKRVGEDTTLSKIIQMVSDVAATKAPIAKIADKVSGVFVPIVIGLSVLTFIVWLLAGRAFGFSLARAISVLVISCPCALGLATPVAIMVGNGVGAKKGIMFKTAESLERTGKIDIVALDKTGTITKGEPQVVDWTVINGFSEAELFETAYSLEAKSEHPLARAVVEEALKRDVTKKEAKDFKTVTGNGVTGIIEGKAVASGNSRFISSFVKLTDEDKKVLKEHAKKGQTPLLFAKEGELVGTIFVADVIKEDSALAIKELKEMGLKVVMLTGDNKDTAETIGEMAGVDEVVAGVLPDGKERVIELLQEHGKVMMVGDGINDAPALTKADIGIAIGAGTDIAIDAAEVVVVKNSLMDVARAIKLSKATIRNIHENLFWAFFYNMVGIPLAAGVWIPIFGWTLNPMFGAAAMSLSSFFVVTNALRLNMVNLDKRIKIAKSKNITGDEPLVKINEKEQTMEIKVNGMMCPHCEAHVKKDLEAIEGIETAVASHETGIVSITTSKEVSEEVIKEAIKNAGYEYVGLA